MTPVAEAVAPKSAFVIRDHERCLATTVCYMTAETKCVRKKRAPRTFFPVFRG
jgi:hypothetical protein